MASLSYVEMLERARDVERAVAQAEQLYASGYAPSVYLEPLKAHLSWHTYARHLLPRWREKYPHIPVVRKRTIGHLLTIQPEIAQSALGLARQKQYEQASRQVAPYLGYHPTHLTWRRWLRAYWREASGQ